jgi:hypothetical protein
MRDGKRDCAAVWAGGAAERTAVSWGERWTMEGLVRCGHAVKIRCRSGYEAGNPCKKAVSRVKLIVDGFEARAASL